MPLISQTETGFLRHLPETQDEIKEDGPGFLDVVQASFENENTLVNWAANGFSFGQDFLPQEGYNPFNDIEGYELYADSFIDVKSPEHAQAVKMQIDNETRNMELIGNSGFTGVLSQIAAGATDPVYWPLMLTGTGQTRMAMTTGQAFRRAAVVGGASEIPAEAIKQQLQETRTIQESAFNIGGAAVLSGLLGAGLNKLAGNPKYAPEIKRLEEELEVWANSDEPGPLSVGAAQNVMSKEDLELVGAGGLEKLPVSPLVRTQTSPSVEVNRVAAQMMETPLVSKGNIEGKSTTPEGGTAETRIKRWDFNLYEGLLSTKDNYASYLKSKGVGAAGRITGIHKQISFADFRREIGKAMRRGDKHQIPEVAQAARDIRKKGLDPLKDAAIKERLLPENVDVSTAESYLMRVYRHDQITARRPEWNKVVDDWLKGIRESAKIDMQGKIQSVPDEAGIDKTLDADAVARKLDDVVSRESEVLDSSIQDIKGISKEVDKLSSKLDKSSTKLQADEKVMSELEREYMAVYSRAAKFATDEGYSEIASSITKNTKELEKVDSEIKQAISNEKLLYDEAKKNISRFLSDRARGLEKREKAFSQNYTRIQKSLSDIRAKIAGLNGEKLQIIEKIQAKTDEISALKPGNKQRASELDVSMTRLKNRINKFSESIESKKGVIDDIEREISDFSESIRGIREDIGRRADIVKRAKKSSKSIRSAISEAGITDDEIAVIRNEITDNIMGVSNGRTSYDVVQLERGPLKERVFNIPDSRIEDFLESDIDVVLRQYVRTMAPDVELNRMFGTVTLKDQIDEINDAYAKLINEAKTEKKRETLKKRQENDVRDLAAMRDRLRGTYMTPKDPNSFFLKAGRTIRDFNFMRLLGGMTLSAIPDVARLAAVNGLKPIGRSFTQLVTSPKRFGLARTEAKKAAVGMEMVLNSRAASLAEIADASQRGSAFERGMRGVTDTFSKWTLMSQWNDALKQFSGVTTSDRILTESLNWANGKISKSAMKRLAASGIDEGLAKRIASQFAKHGDDGIIKLPGGDKWDDSGALETFRSAVLKDVDRTIVTPGAGEKPLWTSSETGKMIFQFKTFAAVAHHKVLMAGIQYRDAAELNGFLLATALGGVTYGLKNYIAGREVSTDPKVVIQEALDRSGVFGYFWDVNNISAKFTNGEVSVERFLGGQPMSRYASRNIWGALLGPTIDAVEDMREVTGNAATGEFSEKDINRIRKMLPGQNLFYIRQLLDSLQEELE